MGGAMKPRRKEKRLKHMKKMIIAFLTSSENYETWSVADALHCFKINESSIQEDLNQLGQKLESAFHQRLEVSVSEWIADEDIEAFDEMVAAYEAL